MNMAPRTLSRARNDARVRSPNGSPGEGLIAEHPPLDGALRADVAVVGGGITGLTAAWLLQREGRSVALVEAEAVGAGTTGATSAHVTSVLDISHRALRQRLGVDRASIVSGAARAAFELIRRLGQGECVRGPFDLSQHV